MEGEASRKDERIAADRSVKWFWGVKRGKRGRKGGRRTQTRHGQGSVEFPLLFVSMS